MKTLRSDGIETRARLKEVAQRLFALRGIDGVSVQEIIDAAGQRNNASLRYYFGTKLELARELVVDGARQIDERRQAVLDQLERDSDLSVVSVMNALTVPLLEFSSQSGQYTYIRMIANLQLNNRVFLREALEDTWNTGYKRCFAHLLKLLDHIPRPLLEQRLSLVSSIYGNAVWAAWEAAQDSAESSRLWSQPYTIENVQDTLRNALEAPPSEATLAQLKPAARKRSSSAQREQG